MNVSDIKKEGRLIVAKADGVEYAAKSAIQLIRILCSAGMSSVQAGLLYVNIKQGLLA